MDTVSYTPHLSRNSLIFPIYFFFILLCWVPALVGSSLSGWAKELFLYIGTANKVLVMAQSIVMVCDTHRTAWGTADEPHIVWGAVFGCTVIISKMKQSHGDS